MHMTDFMILNCLEICSINVPDTVMLFGVCDRSEIYPVK